jgi:glycosyltransferase involved in cell wall biosynthesis
MNKIRLHIFGLPHTITRDEYSHCAFTGKIQRFSPMMKSVGYEVYYYGNEGSITDADVQVDILSLNEFNQLKYASYKMLFPNLNDNEIINKMNNRKEFIAELANHTTPIYKEFNTRVRDKLINNYRSTKTDIICLPFGFGHEDAIKGLNVICVESGIGYSNAYKNYRIYESYAIMHYDYSRCNTKYENYWFVCPNYYNINDWDYADYPDKPKFGFFGRICSIKGTQIILELAKLFPSVEFVFCGQGQVNINNAKNITCLDSISGRDRSNYLNSLTALITPSMYLEPFCGVSVEAQLCGTPVISHDYGAFVENIEQFKTGLRCHTLSDFCYGVEMAINKKFDRKYIRERAIKLFDMYSIAHTYDYAFKSILNIHNGTNGWYSTNRTIHLLKE